MTTMIFSRIYSYQEKMPKDDYHYGVIRLGDKQIFTRLPRPYQSNCSHDLNDENLLPPPCTVQECILQQTIARCAPPQGGLEILLSRRFFFINHAKKLNEIHVQA